MGCTGFIFHPYVWGPPSMWVEASSQIICPKDWYQPAVDVAYGPELATFWREAAIECRAKSPLKGVGFRDVNQVVETMGMSQRHTVTWIFLLCVKFVPFAIDQKRPTKRQTFYISRRPRYIERQLKYDRS